MHHPMRIAVIADTHDRYPPCLPQLLTTADEIWHLGDVCDPAVLSEFEQLRRPLRIVRGNNDTNKSWPLSLTLRRNGVRFHLVHIPPRHPPACCDVVVHGHTHVPRDETVGRFRWLNPGCISRPNQGSGPSFGWLTFEESRLYYWEVVPL
jgi:putative phosphoesterase